MIRLLVLLAGAGLVFAQTEWKAGVAKTVITPDEPIWLAGFASRTKPSEGIRQDIYVRALAIQDASAHVSVIVTMDLTSIDPDTAEEIAARCRTRFGITRDRLVLNISHTHSSPVAGLKPLPFYGLTSEHREIVQRYTTKLMDDAVTTVGKAIQSLAPASLTFEQGLAGIAVNRRRVGARSRPGPVDHDVPVLAVQDAAGSYVAIVVGYACHPTALNDYLVSNDWPGFAQEAIEKAHPSAISLFIQGCGADANPLPRGGEEQARKRGEILAAAVEQVLTEKMRPVTGPLRSAFERVDLPLRDVFTREELQKKLDDPLLMYRASARTLLDQLDREGKLPDRYPYPVQVWQFGTGLKFIALGGEVVADYSLRLKSEHGFDNTWVAGYSNDVLGYIPSRRVLQEGGYEGGGAMILFGRSGRFGAAVEEIIVEKVADLVQRTND